MADATRFAVVTAAFKSSTSASKIVDACRFVTTRQWPVFSGLMSKNVRVRSSSAIFTDGILPSRIMQNTHSLMAVGLLHLDGPAIGIRRAAVLDAHDRVVETLGQRSDLSTVDHHALTLVGQLPDGRDDRGRSRAPDLFECAATMSLLDLVDGHLPLADAEAPLAHEREGRVARHARQDRARQRRRDDLIADLDHDVHGPDLVDVLPVDAVEPEDLRVARVLRFLAGE